MPIVKSTFKPAWWLSGSHLQTLWPTLFRKNFTLKITEERIELDDGDFIDLAWSGPEEAKIVLILHGLEGSKNSSYIQGVFQTLSAANYRCCLMHFRGCSGEVNRLARSYHSGDTGDIKQIIQHIKNRQNKNIFAILGYSLGGNAVLKWLGEKGNAAEVTTAAAVSVPFSLDDAAKRMEVGFSRVYERHLISRLQQKYRNKFSKMQSPLNIEIDQLNSFYLFDDQITAPLHGFKNVHDYYSKSSCGQFLKSITKPTLILHAKDDPFMWPTSIPNEKDIAPNVQLELSEKGGHVGFINGSFPWKPKYWLDQRILEWLNSQK